jgi:hypothetical protein
MCPGNNDGGSASEMKRGQERQCEAKEVVKVRFTQRCSFATGTLAEAEAQSGSYTA